MSDFLQQAAQILAGSKINEMTVAEAQIADLLVEQKYLHYCKGKSVLPLPEYDKYILNRQSEEVLNNYHGLYLALIKKPGESLSLLAMADLFEEIGQERRVLFYRSLAEDSFALTKLYEPLTENGRAHKKGKYKYRVSLARIDRDLFLLDRLRGKELDDGNHYFKTYDEMIDALLDTQKW